MGAIGHGTAQRGVICAVAALMGPLGAPLGAQQPSDSVPPVPLDTLSVDVLRTPASLASSPYAVSVAGRDELRDGKAGLSLEEALQAVPGIQLQNRYNWSTGERVAIRGLGARAQFGIRGLKVLVDRIPATLPDGQSTLDHLDLGSLGRVEVLRGPASSLYGNAAGGVLSFTTQPPPPVPIRPEVLGVTGSDGLARLQGTVAGTAGRTRYTVDVAYFGYDGFRTDPTAAGGTYSRAERVNVNGQLGWDVSGGELAVTLNYMDLGAQNPGALPDSLVGLDEKQAWGFNVIQNARKDVRQGQAGASWTGPLGRALRGEFTLFGVVRSLDNPIPPSIIDLDRLAGGLRAVVGSDTRSLARRTGWMAGADLEFQRDDRLNFANDGGQAGEAELDQLENVQGVGLFVHGGLRLGERVHLDAGLRYDRSHFEADDRLPERLPGAGLEDQSGSRTMDALSPSVGVSFEAGPSHTLFGSVSSLFSTPTTTELANQPDGSRGFNQELEPEKGLTFEVGARGALGMRAGYDVALFLTDLDDELIPFEVPGEAGRSFFKNAGSSRYQGVEASLSGDLGAGLHGRVTYTYTDAEFRTYVVDGQDLSGNRIPGQAPHRFEAVLRGDWGGGFAEARYLFMDAIPADDADTASADSYSLLDVRAGFKDVPLGALVVSPFGGVTNVLDETYVTSVVVNAFGGRYFEPGPPRSFYLGVSLAWPGLAGSGT